MENKKKGLIQMKLLNVYSKYIKNQELFIHSLHFEFAGKEFRAIAHDDEVMTNIAACYEEDDIFYTDIDIPTYFGKGFSSEIYDFLYAAVEEIDREVLKK